MASLDRVIYAGWLVVLGLGPILYSTNVHRNDASFYEQEESEHEEHEHEEPEQEEPEHEESEQEEHTYHDLSAKDPTQTILFIETGTMTAQFTTPSKLEATDARVDDQFFVLSNGPPSDGIAGEALNIKVTTKGYYRSATDLEAFRSDFLFKATPTCPLPIETSSHSADYDPYAPSHLFMESFSILSSRSYSRPYKITIEATQSPPSVILGIFIGIFISYIAIILSAPIAQVQKRKHPISSEQEKPSDASTLQIDCQANDSFLAPYILAKNCSLDTSDLMPSSVVVDLEDEYMRNDETIFLSQIVDEAGDPAIGYIENAVAVNNTAQAVMTAGALDVLNSENETDYLGEEYAPGDEVDHLEVSLVAIGDPVEQIESSGSDEELESKDHDALHETILDHPGDLVDIPSESAETRQESIGADFSKTRYVPPHKRAPSSGVKYTNMSSYTHIPPAGKIQSRIPIASLPRKPKELTSWWQAEYEKFRIFMESRHERTQVVEDEGSNVGNDLEWRQREEKSEQATWLKWCTSRLKPYSQQIKEESNAETGEGSSKEKDGGSGEICLHNETSTAPSKSAVSKNAVTPLSENSTSATRERGNEAKYSTCAPSRVLLLHKGDDSNACASSSGGLANAGRSCAEGNLQAQVSKPGHLGIRDFLPVDGSMSLTDESSDF